MLPSAFLKYLKRLASRSNLFNHSDLKVEMFTNSTDGFPELSSSPYPARTTQAILL